MIQDRKTAIFYPAAICNLNCRYCSIDKNPILVEIDKQLEESFKGDYYIVVDVAQHSETDEQLVIYRTLYGDGKLYARPYEMFMSKVDREKYPDVEQEYRFQLQDIESVNK